MAMRRWRRGARGALTVIGAALATFLAGISMQVTSRAVGGAPPDTAAVVRRLPVGRLALRGGSSGAPAATASSSEDVAEAEKPDDFPHIPTDELDEDEREDLARLLTRVRLPGETRTTRRWASSRAGGVDRHATVRRLLAAGQRVLASLRR